ncbi:hypothetical protein AAG906_018363 [Vitis piasezkii]
MLLDQGFKASSSGAWKARDVVPNQFPESLQVLVVDDDPTWNKSGFDIIISDVHMPDMDRFKLLEHIGLDMDLPGVTHSACDYLIKYVRIEALKNIWQHDLEQSGSVEDGDRQQKPSEDVDYSSSENEGNWENSKRRQDEEDDADERDDTSTLNKSGVVWLVELHQQFVAAVKQLTIDKLMNVPGLTRENVASHLQKYRFGRNNSFMGPQEATFGPISSLNGLDLQTLAVAGQLPTQSLATLQAAGFDRSTGKSGLPMPLVDQRNLFSFEALKFIYGEGQQQQQQLSNSSKQMNLLHGILTTMEPKQLATLRQSAQSFRSINMQVNAHGNDSSSLLMQMAQPQTRTHNPLERIPYTGVLPFKGTFPIGNLILEPRLGFFKDTFFQKLWSSFLGFSLLFYFSF